MVILELLLLALVTVGEPAGPEDAHAFDLDGGRLALETARSHEPMISPPPEDLAHETAERRSRLAAGLGPSVLWIQAPAEQHHGSFWQSDDVWYLTGVAIPELAAALVIDADGTIADEILFLPAEDTEFELWNGDRLSPGPAAVRATGFARTLPLADAAATLLALAPATVHVIGAPAPDVPSGTRLDTETAVDAVHRLRHIKSPYEVRCIKGAVDITAAAMLNALYAIRPGAFEYMVEGEIVGTYRRLGSERDGFPSICGSGPNSVTLHYNANRAQLLQGDMILMDIGAKFHGYSADITRTVPVDGRFTARQRDVYEVVLEAQRQAEAAARPGVTLGQLDAIAREVFEEHGFGRDRTYFKHFIGHWLGMDVHDVGGRETPMQAGCVFTIEPGLYIAEENLGIRIEDDYLMTEHGAIKLSAHLPSHPDRIQALMAARP